MSVELRFLGWDAPLTTKVSEFLLPQGPGDPSSLAGDVIVAPTRQAGRRLRETLAVRASSLKMALPSLRVVTPAYFLQAEDGAPAASPLEVTAVWAHVLLEADPGRYRGLFPARVPSGDFRWALRTGEMIEELRRALADGGYSIADVLGQFGGLLEEKERWRDLARLEEACLERQGSLGLHDPLLRQLRHAGEGQPPAGTERLVLASLPDPTPLLVKMLERLAARIPVVVLVHAPEALAGCFDGWGRPIPERWRGRRIEVPDSEANILLGGPPWSQSRRAMELMGQEADRFGPADVALGVPDNEVVPFLEADLAAAGLVAFNPAGRQADRHPLAQLLSAFRGLVREGDYAAASAFLRHADFMDYLQHENRLAPGQVLEEADAFHSRHLPQSFDGLVRGLERVQANVNGHDGQPGHRGERYPSLEKALSVVADWVRAFQMGNTDDSLRSFLAAVYEHRLLDVAARPGDAEFAAVAEGIDAGLRSLAPGAPAAAGLDRGNALDLLLWSLEHQSYYPEPEGPLIDLEGWLELPWNDAPFLIVTGMNDGKVPDTRPADVFLPDTLRRQLRLRHDEERLARDAYLMSSFVESRRRDGRVCFIAGKTGASGDVLKPSRLLFQCSEAELPGRAERLFATPVETESGHPSSISFRLAAAPPDVSPDSLEIRRIRVTAFREYLQCPFRYYLKYVLGMEALDDRKVELDAMDFGSLVHYALHCMSLDAGLRRVQDVPRLQDFLCARAEDWVDRWCGSPPPPAVELQLESARQRLRQAAAVQARLVGEGWETLHAELDIKGVIDGVEVRGRIDRVDRHGETGRIRLLDYKTSSRGAAPGAAHFGPVPADRECPDYALIEVGGRQRRWTDLQVPLYAILLPSTTDLAGPFELGYFNLPRTLDDTGVVCWSDAPDNLLESARHCAEGVISDIRNRRFWPPAQTVTIEEFASVFPGDPARCIDAEAFQDFLRQAEAGARGGEAP